MMTKQEEARQYDRDVMNRLYGFFIGTFMLAGFAVIVMYMAKEGMKDGLRERTEH